MIKLFDCVNSITCFDHCYLVFSLRLQWLCRTLNLKAWLVDTFSRSKDYGGVVLWFRLVQFEGIRGDD